MHESISLLCFLATASRHISQLDVLKLYVLSQILGENGFALAFIFHSHLGCADGSQWNLVDSMAVVALYVITCSKRIADIVSADSADKKSECWLDFRHLMAAAANELVSVAWNLLFGFAFFAIYYSILKDIYTGGT